MGSDDQPSESDLRFKRQEGRSKFQAEVQRLKSLLAFARTHNLLFLLDEILTGANSHDRYAGARGVIEQLVRSNALGRVTTHDLALTKMVQTLDGRVINMHFEDRCENGQLIFDYQMRPGELTRSNGISVMESMGLISEPSCGGW